MKRMLIKEFSLAIHPTAILFLFFGAFVFIPNYPYEVMFFFSTLSIFFISLTGRENKDIYYSCMLPTDRAIVVKARILMVNILQLSQIIVAFIMIVLKSQLLPDMRNEAGMDANLMTLFAGFVIFGMFNLTFFTAFFKDPNRVGVPFLVSSIITFLIISVQIALTFTLPYIKELDNMSREYTARRFYFLAIGILFFVLCNVAAIKLSEKRFEKVDL